METRTDLTQLKKLLGEKYNSDVTRHDNSYPCDIKKALDYIEKHVFEPSFSVKTLREVCGLRNHNISSRFKFFCL